MTHAVASQRPLELPKGTSLNSDENEDTTVYKAVVNYEKQYSIWPADRENALGWKNAGKVGTKEPFLAYIKEIWPDMQLASLREKVNRAADQSGAR